MADNNQTNNKLPSAFSLFGPSANIIKNNLTAFLILAGIPLALLLIGQGSALFANPYQSQADPNSGLWGIISLIGVILTILTAPAVILLQLKGAQKQNPTFETAFKNGLPFILRIFGLGILMALMLLVAFLLLIIPFFILLPRIILAPYYLVDRNMGIVDSLKASMANYKEYKGTWGIIGVEVLIGFTGGLPVIGSIVSAVLSFLYAPALAIRYTQIKSLDSKNTSKNTKPSND